MVASSTPAWRDFMEVSTAIEHHPGRHGSSSCSDAGQSHPR